LVALAALLVANGFFVAGEFGLVAIDRNRLESLRAKGDRRAGMVAEAVRDLTFHLSGAQLGVTTSSLLIGFVAEPSLARLLEPGLGRLSFLPEQSLPAISVGVALGIATALQMVMSELVPKNLAIARPLAAATLAGLPMIWLNRLIKPVILT
jgi:CBS domain containing-hemolysin-like protein